MATLRQDTVKLTIHYEDAGDGWIMAQISEVPGAISQGRSRDEARQNVIDALQTVLTPDEQLAGSSLPGDDELLTLTVS
jgi:predicted RNase H-like HicB family nuclease